MSDGYSDMIAHYHRLVDDYLEAHVQLSEAVHLKSDMPMTPERAAVIFNLQSKMKEIPDSFMTENLGLPARWIRPLICEIPDIEFLLLVLHRLGKFIQLIRLQKASSYKDKLLVFINERGCIAEKGVYYSADLNFRDGDQDILWGQAKKRRQGKIPDLAILIIASWNKRKKCFQVDRDYQV